jgi:hypothetical protein
LGINLFVYTFLASNKLLASKTRWWTRYAWPSSTICYHSRRNRNKRYLIIFIHFEACCIMYCYVHDGNMWVSVALVLFFDYNISSNSGSLSFNLPFCSTSCSIFACWICLTKDEFYSISLQHRHFQLQWIFSCVII